MHKASVHLFIFPLFYFVGSCIDFFKLVVVGAHLLYRVYINDGKENQLKHFQLGKFEFTCFTVHVASRIERQSSI